MVTVGIRELKNNLSHYMGKVRNGTLIIITDRGEPVARLIKESKKKSGSLKEKLAFLENMGLIKLPEARLRKRFSRQIITRGKKASDMVLEGRR